MWRALGLIRNHIYNLMTVIFLGAFSYSNPCIFTESGYTYILSIFAVLFALEVAFLLRETIEMGREPGWTVAQTLFVSLTPAAVMIAAVLSAMVLAQTTGGVCPA